MILSPIYLMIYKVCTHILILVRVLPPLIVHVLYIGGICRIYVVLRRVWYKIQLYDKLYGITPKSSYS